MAKARKISISKADKNKLFYFVANVVIYRKKDSRCLILKRSQKEKVHPGKWCVLGGKLEYSDLDLEKPTRMNGEVYDFENIIESLLAREVYEEAGIEIFPGLHFINDVAFVRTDGIPVVLVKFAARYKGGRVKIEKDAFDDFAWVDAKEVKKYDFIQGIDEEVAQTIELFAK